MAAVSTAQEIDLDLMSGGLARFVPWVVFSSEFAQRIQGGSLPHSSFFDFFFSV